MNKAEQTYKDTKKSLETLLREKAYSEVQKSLKDQGVDIENVSDEDIESLVAAKINDMKNNLKGFGAGAAFTLALSLFIGV